MAISEMTATQIAAGMHRAETIKVCSVCGFRRWNEDGIPECLGHSNMRDGVVHDVERSRAGYRRPKAVKHDPANFPFVGKPKSFGMRMGRR